MNRTIPYHSSGTRYGECSKCGELANCTFLVADVPEYETGYVDEALLCEDCESEMEVEW